MVSEICVHSIAFWVLCRPPLPPPSFFPGRVGRLSCTESVVFCLLVKVEPEASPPPLLPTAQPSGRGMSLQPVLQLPQYAQHTRSHRESWWGGWRRKGRSGHQWCRCSMPIPPTWPSERRPLGWLPWWCWKTFHGRWFKVGVILGFALFERLSLAASLIWSIFWAKICNTPSFIFLWHWLYVVTVLLEFKL